MQKEDRKAIRLIISGKVQGVWFRAWTIEKSQGLLLDGWVRNRADGTVEALIVGPSHVVEQMIELCRVGPERAQVSDIQIHDALGITPKGFVQKPTVDIDERRD